MTEDVFNHWFARMPVVAILRGLKPEEAMAIGEALVESSWMSAPASTLQRSE